MLAMSSLPPDFWTMLGLLAKACDRYRETTGRRAIIVGGAAVSFYTQGAILSGDVDMVADIDFEHSLLAEGFEKETGPGKLLGGYFHPDVPRMSVELVSGSLFDGLTDKDRLLAIQLTGDGVVHFPPIEDMIADRLGQFASSKNKNSEMLKQASILMTLAIDYDPVYLRRRILEEGGDPAAIGLV